MDGDILVTEMTTPDFVPAMKRAAAIVTDRGGRTAHAAIVSRELGIPCVVGTGEAMASLANEQVITVDGSTGKVYDGKIEIAVEAETKAKAFEADPKYDEFATMMVKTHLSLSHDPTLKGVPKGWTLPIRDVLVYSGAKFLCPCAGTITLMPGTSSDPAFRKVDVDVNTGKVMGLF